MRCSRCSRSYERSAYNAAAGMTRITSTQKSVLVDEGDGALPSEAQFWRAEVHVGQTNLSSSTCSAQAKGKLAPEEHTSPSSG